MGRCIVEKVVEFQGEYRWLSNFWPCRVWYDGNEYPSVEHAYQAAKTTDVDVRRFISTLSTPGEAKRAGQTIELRGDWGLIKLPIMLNLVRLKFRNPQLKEKLISTGDMVLEEGNKWGDKFWGIDLKSGKGENNLGEILMIVRKEIRDAEIINR